MAGGYFTLNFLIIDEKEKIKEIAKWSEQDWIKEAPYVVLFITDAGIATNVYKERGELYSHQQAGGAIQTFMLSLIEKGLSSCWVGHFNEDKIKFLFKIPNSRKIEAIIPVGYEKEKPKTRKIQAELYNRVNYHEWGNKRMHRIEKVEHYYPEGYKNSKI